MAVSALAEWREGLMRDYRVAVECIGDERIRNSLRYENSGSEVDREDAIAGRFADAAHRREREGRV